VDDMTRSIVTELPRRLEPITTDPFIDGLAAPVDVACLGAAAPPRIRRVRDPLKTRRLSRDVPTL
jgi:hypothetical protein